MISCPHLPPCPGCPRFGHTDLPDAPLARLRTLCDTANLPAPTVITMDGTGYRHRARLAIRGRVRSPKIGLFRRGTHDVVDTPRCPIHRDPINRVVAQVKTALLQTRTPPYSDHAHAGIARYLQLVIERRSSRVQLVVVTASETPELAAPLLTALAKHQEEVLSLTWNGQPSPHNTILGPLWQHEWGPEFAVDSFGGARVYYPPGAFGQANPELFEQIVGKVHEWMQDCSSIAELFAGVGAIGLGLLRKGHRVTFNEVSPFGIQGLHRGLQDLEVSHRSRATVIAGDAAQTPLMEVDGVIVDPPRKGLGSELLLRLLDARPRRLAYVSCSVASLLRDATLLTEGGYALRECIAYGLFPYTEHVETLCLFEHVR